MSVKILARVWTQSAHKDGDLLVLLAIADFADDRGVAWPAMTLLAKKARLTVRQVRRVLHRLEASGELKIIRSPGGRSRRHKYLVTLLENPDTITGKNLPGNDENPDIDVPRNPDIDVRGINPSIRTVKRVSVKRSLSPKSGESAVKEFLEFWGREYLGRFGAPYTFSGGKEGALVKRLLRNYGLPRLEELAVRFFDSTDPWVRRHGGFTLGVFATPINKLISTETSACSEPPGLPERSAS